MFGTRRSRTTTRGHHTGGFATTTTAAPRRGGLGGLFRSRRRRGVSSYQTEPMGMSTGRTGRRHVATGTGMTTTTIGHGRAGRAPLSTRVKQFLGLGRTRRSRTTTTMGRY